jgi:hypothetical protein
MRRLLFLLPLVLLAAAAYTAPSAHAQDNEEIYIIAYRIPQDENGDRIVTVNGDQSIVLGARWGACTRGLAQAWTNDANVYYEIDGIPLLATPRDSRPFWQRPEPYPFGNPARCIPHTDTIWMVYWRYPLGTLSPGIHEGYMRYWADHQIVDGGDYDGDGAVDHLEGVFADVPFTIVVR